MKRFSSIVDNAVFVDYCRGLAGVAFVIVAATALASCAPSEVSAADPTSSPTQSTSSAAPTSSTPTPSPTPSEAATTLVAVIDGDTIKTSEGTVRLIGIDTPEQGECGHEEASAAISAVVAPGESISLELPEGQNDQDKYNRLLRYVTTASGVDLGLMQIEAGNAVARYDSTDGYPAHPRQDAYRAAQLATLDAAKRVVTTSCQQLASATPVASASPESSATQGVSAAETATADKWWLQYSSCAKLKKNTVGHPTGPFDRDDPEQAEIYDWFQNGTGHRGDGDNDGLACE